MPAPYLLHHLIERAAERAPAAESLKCQGTSLAYAELSRMQDRVVAGMQRLRLERSARIGICLAKSFEWVASAFGAAKAGCCFVPINPVLTAQQIVHILDDCEVRLLVTSRERYIVLKKVLAQCPSLRGVVIVGDGPLARDAAVAHELSLWRDFVSDKPATEVRITDAEMAAIFYTSGSTGKAKGVVVSHRNVVSGALSVASYLENRPGDRLLAALPLSFDAGFSQLTTAFHVGASAVLLNYTVPREVLETLTSERISGFTAVPPIWMQLSDLEWPSTINEHLRYYANTGGKMPRKVLAKLRAAVPAAKPYLMYGLTEAFRSTYLPPSEVDRRPDSMGRAIPNQEILVLRQDGSACSPGEPGELVHRGSTVGLGYWNDPERTAERFRQLPRRERGLAYPEVVVFSGDVVRTDEEGYLYFIGRKDDMIKSSGYRISPVEIEEAVHSTGLVVEAAAIGLPDERLGQAIALVVVPKGDSEFGVDALLRLLRKSLPWYMVPQHVEVRGGSLPRNSNSKIDRKHLQQELARTVNGQGEECAPR